MAHIAIGATVKTACKRVLQNTQWDNGQPLRMIIICYMILNYDGVESG
jgi:hypothetical protein